MTMTSIAMLQHNSENEIWHQKTNIPLFSDIYQPFLLWNTVVIQLSFILLTHSQNKYTHKKCHVPSRQRQLRVCNLTLASLKVI